MAEPLHSDDQFAWPAATSECKNIVDLIGHEAALILIENWGGTRLYIPSAPNENSKLTQVIGAEALALLSDSWRRNQLKVPVAREWRVLVYRARGMSYARIARAAGCSENTVARIMADNGMTGRTAGANT